MLHNLFLFFVLSIGVLIGWGCGCIYKITDNKVELPKHVPSIDEILCVLNMINATYRCSPHEKECIDEAIHIFEEMSLENDEGLKNE